MNPDEIRALIASTVATALEGRSAPKSEPASDTPEARIARLEASNARQKVLIANLSSQPQRMAGGARTVSASASPAYASSEISRLLARCEGSDDSMALREVVVRHQPMLSVKLRAKGGAEAAKLNEAREQAEDILRELCCAADDDGTLREWRITHAA